MDKNEFREKLSVAMGRYLRDRGWVKAQKCVSEAGLPADDPAEGLNLITKAVVDSAQGGPTMTPSRVVRIMVLVDEAWNYYLENLKPDLVQGGNEGR